jgi:facilitated trehalose transporter
MTGRIERETSPISFKILSLGHVKCLSGVYISETAHPSLRGSLAVFQSLFISLGMLIVFGIGYFVDWRTLAWLCGIPGALCFAAMLLLPETPYWLVENNHNSEAL